MLKIDFHNQTGIKINKSFINKVAKKTLLLSGKRVKRVSLSIVFVGKKKIQALNRLYRKKNEATDVLSFNYSLGYNKERIEGELFLCPEMIAENARGNKLPFERELAFVLSHGILHLLGFRHGKRMYKIQDEAVNSYC